MSETPAKGYASLETVERYHTENKNYKAAHAAEHRENDRILGGCVNTQDQITFRLTQGAATMAKLEKQIEDVEKQLHPPLGKVIGWIAAVVVPVIVYVFTVVWYASKYPTREEFKALQDQIQSLDKTVDHLNYRLDPKPQYPMILPLTPGIPTDIRP